MIVEARIADEQQAFRGVALFLPQETNSFTAPILQPGSAASRDQACRFQSKELITVDEAGSQNIRPIHPENF
jgi:hypothetical protein